MKKFIIQSNEDIREFKNYILTNKFYNMSQDTVEYYKITINYGEIEVLVDKNNTAWHETILKEIVSAITTMGLKKTTKE